MTNSAELRARLEAGIKELEGDIGKLRAAIAALDGDSRPLAVRKPSRRAPRAPRTEPIVVPAGKLVSLLNGADGLSTAELARQTGGAPDQILQMLKELEGVGTAHRSGDRRTTRWHGGAPAATPGRRAAPARTRRTAPGQDSLVSESESEAQIAAALDSVVAS